MTEYREQSQAPWTEKEAAAFGEALSAFRDSLPPRQQDARAVILPTAAEAAADQDVQGFFFFPLHSLRQQNVTVVKDPPPPPPGMKYSGGVLYPVGARTDEAR